METVTAEHTSSIHLPPGEVARAMLVVVGILVGVYAIWRLEHIVFLVFLALLVATAIDPLVKRLRRGPFSRGSGTLVVYGALVALIALINFITIPVLIEQAAVVTDTLPARIAGWRSLASTLQPPPLANTLVAGLDRVASTLPAANQAGDGEQLIQVGVNVATLLIDFVTVFVLAFYWMTEHLAIKRAMLRLVGPARARSVNTVWVEIEEKLGGWVRGQLLMMLAIGVMAGIGYTIFGLPNALILAVVAAFGEMIPMIGPFVAFAPAVATALSIDPTKGLIILVYAIVVQQLEAYVLVPRVMRHAVGVSPFTVFLGILVGSTLYGIAGALIAVPVAGAIQVLLAHVTRVEDPVQAEAHHEETDEVRRVAPAPAAPI